MALSNLDSDLLLDAICSVATVPAIKQLLRDHPDLDLDLDRDLDSPLSFRDAIFRLLELIDQRGQIKQFTAAMRADWPANPQLIKVLDEVESKLPVLPGPTTAPDLATIQLDLVIEADFDSFTAAKKQQVLEIIAKLLHDDKIKIIGARPGSVKLVLEMSIDSALRLMKAVERGELRELNIDAATLRIEPEANEATVPTHGYQSSSGPTANGLLGSELERLHEVTCDAYSHAELEQLLRFRMEIVLNEVVQPASGSHSVFELLGYLGRVGRLLEFFRAAREGRPENVVLQQVLNDLERRIRSEPVLPLLTPDHERNRRA